MSTNYNEKVTFECIEVLKYNNQMLHSTVNATQMLHSTVNATQMLHSLCMLHKCYIQLLHWHVR